jgi:hypothetical protein
MPRVTRNSGVEKELWGLCDIHSVGKKRKSSDQGAAHRKIGKLMLLEGENNLDVVVAPSSQDSCREGVVPDHLAGPTGDQPPLSEEVPDAQATSSTRRSTRSTKATPSPMPTRSTRVETVAGAAGSPVDISHVHEGVPDVLDGAADPSASASQLSAEISEEPAGFSPLTFSPAPVTNIPERSTHVILQCTPMIHRRYMLHNPLKVFTARDEQWASILREVASSLTECDTPTSVRQVHQCLTNHAAGIEDAIEKLLAIYNLEEETA